MADLLIDSGVSNRDHHPPGGKSEIYFGTGKDTYNVLVAVEAPVDVEGVHGGWWERREKREEGYIDR